MQPLCLIILIVKSDEHDGNLNHYQLDCFSFQKFVHVNNEENFKALHYWPYVRGIHQSHVDFIHKGPAMQKAFPHHAISMVTYTCIANKLW